MRVHVGDCRKMPHLAEGSVHCSVTSPPYWGLRDYGGDPKEIGRERTPEEYVQHLVEVYREVSRVLRDDGVAWLNLGDTYASANGGNNNGLGASTLTTGTRIPRREANEAAKGKVLRRTIPEGLKAGDLVGIPWRVALALQQDGWYLRSDCIWAKPNPMPESVAGWRWERCRVKTQAQGVARPADGNGREPNGGDIRHKPQPAGWSTCPGCDKCRDTGGLVLRRGSWRPTKAHEYLFQLTKSERYFCDGEAVREAISASTISRFGDRATQRIGAPGAAPERNDYDPGHRGESNCGVNPAGRNPRTVRWVTTRPSKLLHFALMPPDLVAWCILASTPERVCSACGAPWAPVVERSLPPGVMDHKVRAGDGHSTIFGHRPTCPCNAPAGRALVLDPFGGLGTTPAVAEHLGRDGVCYELSATYAALAPERAAEVRRMAAPPRQRTSEVTS